jgi:hypothetical protein
MKVFSLFFLVFVCAITVQAQLSLTVTRSDDRNLTCMVGDCSLREAVNAANTSSSNDTINFAPSVTMITLANEININDAGTLTVSGPGANALTIDGGPGTNRIFLVNNATVTIQGVTLSGGSGNGAAVATNGGAVSLDGLVLQNNSVGVGTVLFGGGTHNISNSTLSNNTNFVNCAAIVAVSATLTVVNTTISGNATQTGSVGAGAVCIQEDSFATFRNSTISGNVSNGSGGVGGGGIYIQNNGMVNLGNTIVAGNFASIGPDLYRQNSLGNFSTSGGNLIGDNSGNPSAPNTTTFPTGNPNANSDKVGTTGSAIDPRLGPLTIANGGTTPTRALLFGSPAIDMGINVLAIDAGLRADQRGFSRFMDGNNDAVAIVDIGAYEAQTAPLAPTAATVPISGYVTSTLGRGISGIQLSLTDSQGNTRTVTSTSGGYYRFEDVQVGETYILSASGKRFTFSQSVQVLNVNEETSEVNFIANSEKRLRSF